MKLAQCPYCKRRIPYFTALLHKTEGEYVCKRCKREANIFIKKQILAAFVIALVFSVIFLIFILAAGLTENLGGIFFVALPFVIFYGFSPFFIKLIPLKKYKKTTMAVQKPQQYKRKNDYSNSLAYAEDFYTRADVQDENFKSGTTKVLPRVKNDDIKTKPINEEIFNKIKSKREITSYQLEKTKNIESFEDISSSREDK